LATVTLFGLPFSRSYFELAGCPSTRTWSYDGGEIYEQQCRIDFLCRGK